MNRSTTISETKNRTWPKNWMHWILELLMIGI